MIVLDTNVLSETMRPKPADVVMRWMRAQPSASLFTTTVCAAEIFFGLGLMPAGRRRTALEQAAAATFDEELADRVLPFDYEAAKAFAEIAAGRRKLGHPINELDAQIAAIARCRGAALATRDVEDFADCGIKIISPWVE